MDAQLAFGERLRAWRKSKKMTQEKLAAASGVHRVAIAQIETGIRGKLTTWDTVQKLSAALGISAEVLTASLPAEAKEEKPAAESAGEQKKSSKPTKSKPSRPKGGASNAK